MAILRPDAVKDRVAFEIRPVNRGSTVNILLINMKGITEKSLKGSKNPFLDPRFFKAIESHDMKTRPSLRL